MSLIPQREARQLREHLETRLAKPVIVDLFVREGRGAPCETCPETKQLLEELAALSDRITLRVHDVEKEPELARERGVTDVPVLLLAGDQHARVRFLGIPSGYEFATLLEGLASLSRGDAGLAPRSIEALGALTGDVKVQVFVTPTCPYCPGVAHLAHLMAIASPRVTAEVVEVSEFPELAERYHVQGVPKLVLNDRIEMIGAQPEASLLKAVLQAAAA